MNSSREQLRSKLIEKFTEKLDITLGGPTITMTDIENVVSELQRQTGREVAETVRPFLNSLDRHDILCPVASRKRREAAKHEDFQQVVFQPLKSLKPLQMSELDRKIVFEYYAPGAQSAALAGTFNEWDSSKCPLRKEENGWWRLALRLPPGRYEYRYLIDGIWENDQRPVICVPNPFGSWNCVIEIS